MKRKIVIVYFVLFAYLSNPITACPLCQAGATKKTQSAYIQTTILLMCIPIIGGGGLFFWLRKKYRKE
jgi:hypothetical protein